MGTNPETVVTGTSCTPNSEFGFENLKKHWMALKYQIKFKKMPYVEKTSSSYYGL